MVLDHVGGDAARIGDGIVDPAVGGHVLPEILNAGIHQFHGVKGASAKPGVACGMGGNALEFIKDLNGGIVGAGDHFVDIGRMPGQGRIKISPDPVPGHKGLGGAAFLPGAAVEDHGPLPAGFFQIVLDGKGSSQGAGAQHVVAAAVAGRSFCKGPGLQAALFLAHAGEGVEFAQDPDDGTAVSVGAGEGSFYAGEVFLQLKAVFTKDLFIKGGGLEFLETEFRAGPDFVGQVCEDPCVILDIGGGFCFVSVHVSLPFCCL